MNHEIYFSMEKEKIRERFTALLVSGDARRGFPVEEKSLKATND